MRCSRSKGEGRMDRCDLCDSDKYVQYHPPTSHFLCCKHRTQYQRHGEFLARTKFDKNEMFLHEDHAEMMLYNRKGEVVARTMIDLEDINKISVIKWSISPSGYVQTSNLFLHRVILNAPEEYVVDHINHNKLDNRKQNLRLCTVQQNNFNRGIVSGKSGYLGVSWA